MKNKLQKITTKEGVILGSIIILAIIYSCAVGYVVAHFLIKFW